MTSIVLPHLLDPEVGYGVDNGSVIVELRAVPDCPNLSATRDVLRACLAEADLTATLTEVIGDYPSPSVLVDGVDVTGGDPTGAPACVLSPPTADQIRAALHRAAWAEGDGGDGSLNSTEETQ